MGDAVKGMDDLIAALDTLPTNLHRNVIRNAVHAAAVFLRDQVRSAAPERRGTLRKAIRASRRPVRNGWVTSRLEVDLQKAFYARFVEEGVKYHTIGRNDRVTRRGDRQDGAGHPGYAGRKYFHATIDRYRDEVLGEVAKKVESELFRLWEKGKQ